MIKKAKPMKAKISVTKNARKKSNPAKMLAKKVSGKKAKPAQATKKVVLASGKKVNGISPRKAKNSVKGSALKLKTGNKPKLKVASSAAGTVLMSKQFFILRINGAVVHE